MAELRNINKRVGKLESNAPGSWLKNLRRTVIIRTIVSPDPNEESWVHGIHVIGGKEFLTENYPSPEEFIAAVNEEHFRVYGKPYEEEEDEKKHS